MLDFTAYIALGDSMSIDTYPALECDLEPTTPLGAAAMLYRNYPDRWPDFADNDLSSRNAKLQFANLAEDGATTWDLLDQSFMSHLAKYRAEPVLITLTLGGNDGLQMLRVEHATAAGLTSQVASIVERYKRVLSQLRAGFPHGTFILNTIYDPTDGSGNIPGIPNFSDKLPFLRYINDQIRECAQEPRTLIADVYKHFWGHGLSASPEDRWYWAPSPIEPGARGASEIRALWLQTLREAALFS
jgi:lysophospholipase L1-like esterase